MAYALSVPALDELGGYHAGPRLDAELPPAERIAIERRQEVLKLRNSMRIVLMARRCPNYGFIASE